MLFADQYLLIYFWLFISLHALQVYREGGALQLFNSELCFPLWYLKAVLCIQSQQLLSALGSLLQEDLGSPPPLPPLHYKVCTSSLLCRFWLDNYFKNSQRRAFWEHSDVREKGETCCAQVSGQWRPDSASTAMHTEGQQGSLGQFFSKPHLKLFSCFLGSRAFICRASQVLSKTLTHLVSHSIGMLEGSIENA